MVHNSELLQTISELAAAFAGFAALVSALASRGDSRRIIDATRLHVAVGGSLIAVLGSLFPSMLSGYLPAADHLWRLSAILVLALNFAYAFAYRSWLLRLRGQLPAEGRSTRIAFWCLEAFLQLAFVGCIVSGDPAFYVTGLVGLLAQAAFVFLGLVTSLVENVAGE